MSLFGKVLRVINSSEFAHVQIAKRSIFDEKFLKVDHHKKEVAFHKKKHAKDNNQLVDKFTKSIESKTTNENSFRQLNSLLFLAKNQNDLDLVTNGIKHLLKEKQIPNNQIKGLASNLMRAVYVLNLPMKGLDYLRDKSLEPLFKYTGYPRVILMNRLMIEKKYEQVVELFEEYYKDGFRVDKEAVKSKPEPNKFFFPHDQFSLVTQALLKMDSPKALEKLKKIMDSIKLRKLEYCNLMVTRCFVLAIKQNDPEYALKLIKKFENLDCTIGFNLTAIAFAKMKFINEALRTVQNIIDLNFEPDERKIHGKFFPFTIKSIQLALDHSKPSPPPILVEKLNLFKEMIKNDKRFIPYDITDYIEKEYA